MTRTDTDTRDVVARLRELAERATPGPWHSEWAFGGWWVVARNGTDYPVHAWGVEHPEGTVACGKANASAEADAARIVAAVNYLSRLLAVAEAAAALSDDHERSGLWRLPRRFRQVRHALDDLDSHEEATG